MSVGAVPVRNLAVRLAVVAAVCGIGLLTGAAPAAAHATLIRTSPEVGADLVAAPRTVSLTFDENIRVPSAIVVTDGTGASVVSGATSIADNVVRRRLRISGDGTYTVAWRVVSADGHPVSGTFDFAVGTTAGPAAGSSTSGHHHGGHAAHIGLTIAGLGLLFGVGLLTVRYWAPDLWRSRR